MTRIASAAVLAALATALAACGAVEPQQLRHRGFGDRCADIMAQSYPGAKIDITVKHVTISTTEHGSLGLMIADVGGIRPDLPVTGGFLARDIAARCRFENGILTQFRWTKGPYRVAP